MFFLFIISVLKIIFIFATKTQTEIMEDLENLSDQFQDFLEKNIQQSRYKDKFSLIECFKETKLMISSLISSSQFRKKEFRKLMNELESLYQETENLVICQRYETYCIKNMEKSKEILPKREENLKKLIEITENLKKSLTEKEDFVPQNSLGNNTAIKSFFSKGLNSSTIESLEAKLLKKNAKTTSENYHSPDPENVTSLIRDNFLNIKANASDPRLLIDSSNVLSSDITSNDHEYRKNERIHNNVCFFGYNILFSLICFLLIFFFKRKK